MACREYNRADNNSRRKRDREERDRLRAIEREERDRRRLEAMHAKRYPIDDLDLIAEQRYRSSCSSGSSSMPAFTLYTLLTSPAYICVSLQCSGLHALLNFHLLGSVLRGYPCVRSQSAFGTFVSTCESAASFGLMSIGNCWLCREMLGKLLVQPCWRCNFWLPQFYESLAACLASKPSINLRV